MGRHHHTWRSKGPILSHDDGDRCSPPTPPSASSRCGSNSAASASARHGVHVSPLPHSKGDNPQQQLGSLVNEVRTLQRGLDELASSVRTLQQRADGPQKLDPSQRAEGIQDEHHKQEEQLTWQRRCDERQMALEEALEQHRSRTEEALAALASNTLSQQSSSSGLLEIGDTAAEASASFERKLKEMSSELLSHAARINRLEKCTTAAAQVQDREQIASAVSELQEKGAELAALFGQQRTDVEELRKLVEELQERVSSQLAPDEEEATGAKATMQSVELQLRELVAELRKLQQEQKMQQSREKERSASVTQTAQLQAATAEGAAAMLGDLREEKGQVADMLEGVRKEKLEVIAMMHSFAMDKDSAFQELEDLRSTTRGELSAAREIASGPAAVATTSGMQQHDSRRVDHQQHSMNARLFSAPAWLPSQISGHPLTAVAQHQSPSIVGTVIAAPAPIPVQTTQSQRLQVGIVASPPAPGPRQTLHEHRAAQRSLEVLDKTPVRRFASTGMSPRFADGSAPIHGWTPAQDVRSVWVGR